MTLQTSGAISLGNVQTEFTGSNPISMSEYYAGGTYVPSGTSGTNGAVPSSGAISMSKFYGTSSAVYVVGVDASQWKVGSIYPTGRDSSGNLYYASLFSTPASEPAYVYKFNASGALQWVKYPGAFDTYRATGDNSGNIFIRNNSHQIIKVNSSGSIAWQKQYTMPASSQAGPIAVDSSGNVYATGLYYVSGSSWHCDVVKFDSTGSLVASKYISVSTATTIAPTSAYVDSSYLYLSCVGASPTPVIIRIALDLSTAIAYKVGVYGGSGEAIPIVADSSGNIIHANFLSATQTAIIKTNSSGNSIVWQKTYTISTAVGETTALSVDSSDNIYLSTGSSITKINSSGVHQWTRTISTTATYDAAVSKVFNGTLVMGSGGANYYTTSTFDGQQHVYDHYEYGDSYFANLPLDGSKTGTYLTSQFVYGTATSTNTTPTYSLTTLTPTLTSRTPTITTPTYTLTSATPGTITASVI